MLRLRRRLGGARGRANANRPMIAKSRDAYRAYRISPGDTNRIVLVFDSIGEQANFVFAIEIFDVGGRTPPNMHSDAQEMFYVLAGEGIAHADGKSLPFR